MKALSQHTLLEFYNCDPVRLKGARGVKSVLHEAVLKGGGNIVKEVFHSFSPYGVSGVIVITESHVAIHTWPEYGYAAVDIFSCSEKLDHRAIREWIRQGLGAGRVASKAFRRGPRTMTQIPSGLNGPRPPA